MTTLKPGHLLLLGSFGELAASGTGADTEGVYGSSRVGVGQNGSSRAMSWTTIEDCVARKVAGTGNRESSSIGTTELSDKELLTGVMGE